VLHRQRPRLRDLGSRLIENRAIVRVRQFVVQVYPRRMTTVDRTLHDVLPPAACALMLRLPPGDRRHAVRVYERLARQDDSAGADAELLQAALLHDVGKADDCGRVYLAHRIAAVLLSSGAPAWYGRLARPSRGRWRHGLYLARYHPELGGAIARQAGCSERVAWLIARHADRSIDDPDLTRLRLADERG
jgi:hypothetical protein